MKIEYDPDKRQRTLDERGLDFDDARELLTRAIISSGRMTEETTESLATFASRRCTAESLS